MIKVIYPSIDKILNSVDSKYILVHILANRSKQIQETGHIQMSEQEYQSQKELGRSLEELEKGLIKFN